ncbi:unnamed protein product [Hermetia illucens]|uniref:CIDE-N domain-containing protein n=1 Tax=Hermetia illucens TaxID=343691 RepID=A0A7R8UZQ8_HERIL|nr:DNA fragmentation factor subunit alpha-like isoform X1 [Hermetia illucens]CAD7089471.1 unnamed protein product [Hermetia illucens]
MEAETRKPFKIKDVTRNIKKAVVAATLEEMRTKAADKFGKTDTMPTIHFDCDGTEVDDEEYFRTLEPNAELIAVFPGERWLDVSRPTHYVTISGRNPHSADQTDAENAKLKKLVGQLQNNLCDVSVVSGPDLDSLSNMDPNSLVDITGKDFMDSIKDSPGRSSEQRTSSDTVELLERISSSSREGVASEPTHSIKDKVPPALKQQHEGVETKGLTGEEN